MLRIPTIPVARFAWNHPACIPPYAVRITCVRVGVPFDKDRSYGLTVRLSTGIPILGWGSGMSVYALVGLRRFKTGFRTDYTVCLNPEPCTAVDEFTSGTDRFDENFTGWVTGGGLEKRVGSVAIRGELRFTDFGSAGRVIPFDDVGVKVPLSLDPSGVGLRAALLWYF